MLTFWQPADGDPVPILALDCRGTFLVAAVRIVWKDVGLDYDGGAGPGPFRYVVEASRDRQTWSAVVDASGNDTDLLIDYRTFDPTPASHVRLRILGMPPGIRPGIIDFTAFGVSEP